jgi:hypothetical protein
MHPILARLERLAAYLSVWFVIGLLVCWLLTGQGLEWAEALVLTLPPLIVYGFVCLSAWYVCRATPIATSGVATLLSAAVLSGIVAGALWSALLRGWIALVGSLPATAPTTERFRQQEPLLLAVSVMLFLLVLSVHYMALAFEAYRTAERQQLELQVLSRDAELRALRAQINPHFLYNSLNSISALHGHRRHLGAPHVPAPGRLHEDHTAHELAGSHPTGRRVDAGRTVPQHRTSAVRPPAADRPAHR